MNILECTIKMKKETKIHYERLAEAVTNNEMKTLFSLLAAAEGEHISKLLALENNVSKFDLETFSGLDETACAYNPHIDLLNITQILKDDSDAYLHIKQEEKETIKFFEQLAHQVESDQTKKICALLVEKEREHLVMLENIYEYVEAPRTFLEWGEFSNLKGL